MQINPRAYPHPVLSHFGDDIEGCVFQGVVTGKGAKNSYVFDAVFKTNNSDLLTLVAQKKAQYAVHVECNTTRYRNIFKSLTEKFSFEIPAGVINGKVELCSFILADKPLEKYKNSNFHGDYGKLSFHVRRGDTLAVGYDQIFSADKKNDPLRNISSILSIVRNDASNASGMDIELGGSKILIRLSKPNYETYMALRQSAEHRPILFASIIVPALLDVLEKVRRASIQGALDAFSERRWYIVLSKRLREMKIDPDDEATFVDSSLKIAHNLMGQPLEASLQRLVAMSEEIE